VSCHEELPNHSVCSPFNFHISPFYFVSLVCLGDICWHSSSAFAFILEVTPSCVCIYQLVISNKLKQQALGRVSWTQTASAYS